MDENGNRLDKKITDFAEEVHNAEMASFIPELDNVVPRQYLDANGTYYYFGKEYGFYMVVDSPYIDLLLVDINYELENNKVYGDSNRENVHTIKIVPLLQQSFYINNDENGQVSWQKYSTVNRPVYYLANPRFYATIQNENAYNDDDKEYSKQLDDGLIIQQTMVDYYKLSDLHGSVWGEVGSFMAGMFLDQIIDWVLKDAIDMGINAGGKEDVLVNTDENIELFTEQAKETQKSNPNVDKYTKMSFFLS